MELKVLVDRKIIDVIAVKQLRITFILWVVNVKQDILGVHGNNS